MKLADAKKRFGKRRPVVRPAASPPKSPKPTVTPDGRIFGDVGSPRGKAFAFTGKLHSMTRVEAVAKLKERGGGFHTTLASDTDYLVIGHARKTKQPSAKLERARKLQAAGGKVVVIGEETFLAMLDGRS